MLKLGHLARNGGKTKAIPLGQGDELCSYETRKVEFRADVYGLLAAAEVADQEKKRSRRI
jgi:hypothetical protein